MDTITTEIIAVSVLNSQISSKAKLKKSIGKC